MSTQSLSDFEVALVSGRLPGRLVRPCASRRVQGRSFRLDAHVTAAGHVLTFRLGWWSWFHLVLAPRGDPLLATPGTFVRIAAEETADELRHRGADFDLTFLARSFAPRVDREYDRMLETIEATARKAVGSLVHRDEGALTVIHFSEGARGITVETNRALETDRRVLSTYTRAERLTSSPRAGS